MKNTNILHHFLDKPCTILTVPVNRDFIKQGAFNESQFADYFFGLCHRIDEDGVWLIHAISKCLSFFPHSKIVGIIEEQQSSDPNLGEKFEKIKQDEKYKDAQVISLESLENLSKIPKMPKLNV